MNRHRPHAVWCLSSKNRFVHFVVKENKIAILCVNIVKMTPLIAVDQISEGRGVIIDI